jgi:enoyl-CoA hydratase/carnithine racemase
VKLRGAEHGPVDNGPPVVEVNVVLPSHADAPVGLYTVVDDVEAVLAEYDRSMSILEVEQRARVRRLRLNRPEKLNALSSALLQTLRNELRAAMDDEDTAVVVVSGTGRAFSAGADVKEAGQSDATTRRHDAPKDMVSARRQVDDWLAIWSLPKPIIAQVHGYCLGMANELIGCCDLVVCSASTRFGFPEMRDVALFTTLGFWPDRIGIQRTKELAFTGRLVEGPEAVALGLAMECVPDAELEARVDELAARIAEVDANRLAVVKSAINGWAEARGVRAAALRGGDYHALFHQAGSPPLP